MGNFHNTFKIHSSILPEFVVEFISLSSSEPMFFPFLKVYGFARRAVFSFLFHPSRFHGNHQPSFGDLTGVFSLAPGTETLQKALKGAGPFTITNGALVPVTSVHTNPFHSEAYSL